MANLNLVDLAARSGSDEVIGLIEDVVQVAPEMNVIPMVPKEGTSYKVTRRTAYPDANFRDVNEGTTPTKSTYVQEVKSMHFLDGLLEVDEAIVKGDDRKIGDVLADEASGIVAGSFLTLGSQTFYGTDADAKGFVGLQSLIEGDSAYEVSASGAAASSCSAYLVELGSNAVHMKVGLDGALELKEWMLQQIVKSGSGSTVKKLMAYVSNFSAYFGLCVPSANNVYRVKLIDSSHKLTDALGAELVSKVPLGHRKNMRWFMNRNAAFWLQSGRSSIGNVSAGADGSAAWAPEPVSLAGFPITVTDSLVQTETV